VYICNHDFRTCRGLMDDNVNESEPLVITVAPSSPSSTKYSCSFSTMIYVLIPICVILDLLAIWYRQTILYLVAVCISILFCCKSSCWASLLVVLQCFVGIYTNMCMCVYAFSESLHCYVFLAASDTTIFSLAKHFHLHLTSVSVE